MKLIHTKKLPTEVIHGNSLLVNRIVAVGHAAELSRGNTEQPVTALSYVSKTKLQTFNRAILPPGKTMPGHIHDDCEEIFYILRGKGEVVINGKTTTISADDTVIVEPGENHEIRNGFSKDLVYLSVRILL